MNEFIEQFLIEARELVDQATGDLLAIEAAPGDGERLDSAFRAFHTLKGAAGIVDFAAMGRAMHAAEDVLARVRAGTEPVTAALVSDCLTSLDQVVQWLDAMQASGEVPGDAEAAADAVVTRFAGAAEAPKPASDWLAALLAQHPEAAKGARTAIRYEPDADCFFRGEDPLALVASLPGLLALDLAPRRPWPPLEDYDPFACNLVLTALLDGAAGEVEALLSSASDQVEIKPLGVVSEPDGDLPVAARALLEEQVRVLGRAGGDGFAGTLASVGRAAGNVLRAVGRDLDAGQVEAALAAKDPAVLAKAIEAALAGAAAPAAPAQAAREPQEAATLALRVDVERIDALVKLVGELTVAKNGVAHAAVLAQDGTDPKALAALLKEQHALFARLLGELERAVLTLRVLPLRHVFQRFPRLVREMAISLGKPADLVTEGDATEADKAVVEALFEPLLHVLRNAVDHGIEDAATRAALGKPPTATIRLRGAPQGEHVIVEVEDDGAGVDVERVRQVALERGVASPEAIAAMTDAEAVDLVFAPGFSTAASVSALSGRGVGMDSVRTAIGRLGGRVRIESQAGQGATVRLTLPFTVMMTRVMTIEAGGQLFGIPLDAVAETVRIERDRIVPLGAVHAFVLRERTVPVIDLAQALGGDGREGLGGDANIVVASAAGHLTGLEVERVGERMEVMLKPMEGLLSGMPGVAGTTLLGDGRVLIVLDLEEMLQWR